MDPYIAVISSGTLGLFTIRSNFMHEYNAAFMNEKKI